MKAHGLMFHHFHNDEHQPGQGSISAATFEDMLHYVGIDRFLSAEEWYRRALEGKLSPDDRCITFDDNLKCQFDVAYPVLRKYNLTAFWFVYTSPFQGSLEKIEVYRHFRISEFPSIESFYQRFYQAVAQSPYEKIVETALKTFDPDTYLVEFPFYTKEDKVFRYVRDRVLGAEKYYNVMDQMIRDAGVDIRKLRGKLWMEVDHLKQLDKEGHIIGLHSHSHPTYLGRLPLKEQKEEYETNASVLETLLGKKPTTVSHPCNSYSGDTLKILKGLGVEMGFRANMFGALASPYEYPREDHANLLKEMEG